MSTHIQPQAPATPAKRDFPKIDRFFDTAEHIVERSNILFSKSKPAILNFFLVLNLIIELILVLYFLLSRH